MDLLACVAEQGDDDFVKDFCRPDAAADNLFPQFDLGEMLFGNAYAFPGEMSVETRIDSIDSSDCVSESGLTLVADDHPMEQLLKMSEKLQACVLIVLKLRYGEMTRSSFPELRTLKLT